MLYVLISTTPPTARFSYISRLFFNRYEQAGCAEQSLSYIAEAVELADRSTPALYGIVHLHLIRIWKRFSSVKFSVTFDNLALLPFLQDDVITSLHVVPLVQTVKNLYSDRNFECQTPEIFDFRFLKFQWGPDLRGDTVESLHCTICHLADRKLLKTRAPYSLLQDAAFMRRSSFSFDTLRRLRRHAALDIITSGRPSPSPSLLVGNVNESIHAFVLAAASCSVTAEIIPAFLTAGQSSSSLRHARLLESCCRGDANALQEIRQVEIHHHHTTDHRKPA